MIVYSEKRDGVVGALFRAWPSAGNLSQIFCQTLVIERGNALDVPL